MISARNKIPKLGRAETFLLIGVWAVVVGGTLLARKWLFFEPPRRMALCRIEREHGLNSLYMTFEGGRTVTIADAEADTSHCPPVGTLVAKRAGEWSYRFDGEPAGGQARGSVRGFQLVMIAGIVLLVVGFVLRIRRA